LGNAAVLLDPRLAEALEIPPEIEREHLAARIASLTGLPTPQSDAAVTVLVAVAEAAQERLLRNPPWRCNDAEAADTVCATAALSAGEETVRDALIELGSEALNTNVRAYVCDQLVHRLADAGHLQLVP
jgi:hypothetical protein